MPTGLQNVHESDDVAVDVRVWILQRIADSCLCGQVDDTARPMFGEETGYLDPVRQIELNETKLGVGTELMEAGFLQSYIIIGVDDIDTDDIVPSFQQSLGGVKADEACGAGD